MGSGMIAVLCILTGLYGIRLAAGVIESEYRTGCRIRKAENRIRARKIARRRQSRRLAELDSQVRLETENDSG